MPGQEPAFDGSQSAGKLCQLLLRLRVTDSHVAAQQPDVLRRKSAFHKGDRGSTGISAGRLLSETFFESYATFLASFFMRLQSVFLHKLPSDLPCVCSLPCLL